MKTMQGIERLFNLCPIDRYVSVSVLGQIFKVQRKSKHIKIRKSRQNFRKNYLEPHPVKRTVK